MQCALHLVLPGQGTDELVQPHSHLEVRQRLAFVEKPEFITVDNAPRGYRESFVNRASARVDPVMQHCKRNSMPIIWDQQTYAAHGLGDKWEEQARFGYRYGIAMALHLPEGRHFFLGVDRDRPISPNASEVTRLVADLRCSRSTPGRSTENPDAGTDSAGSASKRSVAF